MLTDTVDFVRQGALIAHAMILMQVSVAQDAKVDEFRKSLATTLSDKHESVRCVCRVCVHAIACARSK
jgi:26S proteasome regulatory subunit N2